MLQPPVLEEMLTTGRAPSGRDTEGTPITRAHAEALLRVVGERRPAHTIEIGMAFGASTLAILAGGPGSVTSIDPFQEEHWGSNGVDAVQRAGFEDRHTLIEDQDYFALPDLLRDSTRCQFAYIDGRHTFDYVVLDFFYIDKMLDVGGVVAFNDCWLPAVHRAIKFAQTHRSYRELDAGLEATYGGRTPLHTARRRLLGMRGEDRYFEKVAETGEPVWNFYKRF